MRRAQIDKYSQAVRNLATNPQFETTLGTVTTHTNLAQNPSFETTSGTVDVRTNLFTNPAFETTNGTHEVRRNLATNPSFEATSGVTNVRTNLFTNPRFEGIGSLANIRTNLNTNTRGVSASPAYSGEPNQTITANVTITGNPDGITTGMRVSYTDSSVNPGISLLDPLTSGTQYTASVWVFHETVAGGSQGIAQEGIASGAAPAITQGVWQRVSWTFTANGTSKVGYRVSAQTGSGSYLVTGLMVEARPDLGSFFDGATAATFNLASQRATSGAGTGGSATLTTNVSYAGQTWTRAATVAGTSSVNARHFVDLSSLGAGGKVYTVAVTVANDQAFSQSVVLDWCDTNFLNVTLASGETRRITITGSRSAYDNTYRFADLQVNQSSTEGRSILFKDWVIEEGTTLGYYYPTNGNFTYGWAGTANASASYQRAYNVSACYATTTATTYSSVMDPVVGTRAATTLTKGASGDGISFPDISVSAGKSYTFSSWVKTTAAHRFDAVLRWKDSASAIISDTTTEISSSITVGQWTRVSITGTAPTNTTLMQPMWRIYAAHTPTTFYVDGVLIAEGSVDIPYFDGSTTAEGDFTYVWSGTANASTSYQQAPTLSTWQNRWYGSTGGSGTIYQAKGGLSGTYARKLWIQANTGSSMDVGINTPKTAVNPNTAYTLSAWVRTSVAQNFNFYIEWKDSADATITSTPKTSYTAVTANTWTRVSVTGTSPSNATDAYFTIGPYAGALAMPSGSTMDVDNVLVESTPFVRDYFDGSNPIKNMETNPSFDVNTTGWTATNLTTGHGRTSARAYSGAYSITAIAVDTSGDSMYTNSVPYTVEPGATYTLSAYAWVPSGVVAANFRESSRNLWAVAASPANIPSLVRSGNLDFTKTNQWQRVSTTITIPEGSTKLNIRLYFPAHASGMYWDAVLVEKTSTLNPYYEGTGDFTYHWAGTANASISVQQAIKVAGIGYANQADVYQIGTAGNYKARILFNNNTIGDSGANFSSGISAGASKTYTISMDATSDIARTVKFSAQGSGTINSGTAPISIPAGTTRLSWTFTTSATAPTAMALYILRADLLMGTLDISKVLVEEGSTQIGGYFDGTTVLGNLVANSNFETDTTGWLANTGNPTLSASTDRSYLGTKSLKAVNTLANGDVAVMFSATLKADTTYAVSYYVYSGDARTAAYMDMAASNFNIQRQGEKALQAGVWTRMSAIFTTPSNIVGSTAFYLHNAGGPAVVGSTVYIDCVLLEESNHLNQYYDGASDFTFAWTGTAHASTSVQRGVAVSRANHERAAGVSTTRNGDKVLRVIPLVKGHPTYTPYAGSDVFVNLYNQTPALKPNTTYTLVSTIILEAPLSAGIAKWRINIDTDQSSPVFPNTVGEHTQNWQFTTGATATINFIRFMPGPSGVAGFTNEVILKNMMIIEGPYTGKYFDGTTAAETDFSYFWTGTAHNSTSYKRGNGVAGMTSGNSFVVHSGEWSASGTKSLRITPTNQYNTTSCIIYNNESGANVPLPLEKGKTYTALATRRLVAPLTGTLSSYAGTISFVQTGIGTAYSPVLPNVAGVAQARLTFKMDPNVTTWTLRLGHGGAEGSGDVWWDNLTIVEGEYTGDHITGTNPFSKWEGTANSSASIGYPMQFLDLAGNPTREAISTDSSSVSYQTSNPPADMGPRTAYFVYEVFATTTSYQGCNTYGTTATGRVSVQTQSSASYNDMGVRLDWPGGENNRVIVLAGARKVGRHVISVVVNNGITQASVSIDGAPDITISVNGGTGWAGNDYISAGVLSETRGVRTTVFNAEHSRDTRVAMMRYLGNKYGASIA